MNDTKPTLFDFDVSYHDNPQYHLQAFNQQVCLVVNVASECGFTKQYQQLQRWYEQYQAKGFTVLAFPCNQFGQQEPASNEQIQLFCQQRFKVTFPVFNKIDVNGKQQSPLYRFLTDQCRGVLGSKMIKWNFTYFLCDRHGNVRYRFSPLSPMASIQNKIEALL